MTPRAVLALVSVAALVPVSCSGDDAPSESATAVVPEASFVVDLPGEYAYGVDIVAADGRAFVVDFFGQSVWRLDADDREFTQLVLDDVSPHAAAIGGGSLWVAADSPPTLLRVDPASLEVTGRVEFDTRSIDEIVYHDGSVWVGAMIGDQLFEVDGDDLTIRRVLDLPAGFRQPSFRGDVLWSGAADGVRGLDISDGGLRTIAVEPGVFGPAVDSVTVDDDTVWATAENGLLSDPVSGLLRIDPATGAIIETLDVHGFEIASDGTSVWIHGGDEVSQFDIATGAVVETTPFDRGGETTGLWIDGPRLWAMTTYQIMMIGPADQEAAGAS
jgi:outer membrane protein assembly factor BamB